MAETLFIRLAENGADASWAAFEADGRLVTPIAHGPLNEARALADGRRIAVLVPAIDVITTQVTLPAVSLSRQRQMLPYTLEDSLAEDVDQLSFAVGSRLESGGTAVAVVAKERMDAWLSELHAAGISPHAIYSEADGVPDVPSTLSLLLQNDRVYARRPGHAPFVVEGLELAQVLEISSAAESEAAELRHVIVYTDAAGRAHFQSELAALGERFSSADVKLVADGLFARFAATIAQRPGTNLLQGAYAPKSNWAALARPWRVAASLLVAAALIGVLAQAVEYWSLRRTDNELTELVAANCQRLLGAGRQSACRTEVQQRLRSAGVSAGGESFLSTLDAVAAARNPAMRVDALSYRNGAMDLQVVAPDIPALDQFTQQLKDTRRFTPTLESSSQNGEVVEGRVKITGAP